MKSSDRVITSLPLSGLFDDNGPVAARRQRDLSADAIRELLRTTAVRFVSVDVGSKPLWIPEAERFEYWKTEANPHLADPNSKIVLDNFPSDYCYIASEWQSPSGKIIIVLEKLH
jgi:hypothetical protein